VKQAGYSGTPPAKKLGIEAGHRVGLRFVYRLRDCPKGQ